MPFKAMIRAAVLIPFIVPTVLSAIAFWWIYDAQFSIISWSLTKLGLIHQNINFLGDANWARGSVIFANIWRGVPFVAITLLAGLQTVSPSLYEAATLDGATNWQRFRFITFPLLTPIIAVVMTFSVLFTFTDFQLIWALTRGGPVNATHLMATLSYQRGIISGRLGEGAAIATAMIPFLLAAIAISWFGMQRRKWQQGSSNDRFRDGWAARGRNNGCKRRRQRRDELSRIVAAAAGHALPAAVHYPRGVAVSVLLDGADLDQAGRTADRHGQVQPVLGGPPHLQAHQQAIVRDRLSALALEHDVCGGSVHHAVDHRQRIGGLRHRAAAFQRS
jgi:ABC-type spermidine/putrescine transport system permease subunit II